MSDRSWIFGVCVGLFALAVAASISICPADAQPVIEIEGGGGGLGDGGPGDPPPEQAIPLGTCNNANQGARRLVTNANSATTCTFPGGSFRNVCRCDDGQWQLEGGSGSSGEGAPGPGATTLDISGWTPTTEPMWEFGVRPALSNFLDWAGLFKMEFDPWRHGPEHFYLVTQVHTIANLPTCNAAAYKSLQVINNASTTGGQEPCSGTPPGATTNNYTACKCELTGISDGAGASDAVLTYGWRKEERPPMMWLKRESHPGATGDAFLTMPQAAHDPGKVAIDLWNSEYGGTAGSCLQLEYLMGRGLGWPMWGTAGFIDQMLLSLGYTTQSIEATRAFWGMTRVPTGIVVNPAAGSPTVQNFTDGWGFLYWGGAGQNQLYAVVRTGNTTPYVASLGAQLNLDNDTKRQNFVTVAYGGTLSTVAVVDADSPIAGTGTWEARFYGKLGWPFVMSGNAVTPSLPSDWYGITLDENQVMSPQAALGSDQLTQRWIFTACRVPSDDSYISMKLYRMNFSAAVYDG